MYEKLNVYAVIRIDDQSAIEDSVTVKEILPSMAEAADEVERLNKLNAKRGARYFYQATRYFPKGRRVQKK